MIYDGDMMLGSSIKMAAAVMVVVLTVVVVIIMDSHDVIVIGTS